MTWPALYITVMHYTVDNNITLTFRFYETTVERKNGFRCTDRRTVEKRNDKFCAMILERVRRLCTRMNDSAEPGWAPARE